MSEAVEKKHFNSIPIIAIAVAIMVVAVIAWLIYKTSNQSGSISDTSANDAYNYLEKANGYMTQLDYGSAVTEYAKALEVDDMNVSAYQEMAEAYKKMADASDDSEEKLEYLEKALSYLQTGYEKTADSQLQTKITNIQTKIELIEASIFAEETKEKARKEQEEKIAKLNEVIANHSSEVKGFSPEDFTVFGVSPVDGNWNIDTLQHLAENYGLYSDIKYVDNETEIAYSYSVNNLENDFEINEGNIYGKNEKILECYVDKTQCSRMAMYANNPFSYSPIVFTDTFYDVIAKTGFIDDQILELLMEDPPYGFEFSYVTNVDSKYGKINLYYFRSGLLVIDYPTGFFIDILFDENQIVNEIIINEGKYCF